MQGPAVNIVILLLLMLFFGIEQRRRPELHFRFWFVGWMAVSLSVMVGLVRLPSPQAVCWHDAMRANRMLVGATAFLLSFLVTRENLRKMLWIGLAFALPALAVMDASILFRPPYWLTSFLLIAGQVAAVCAAQILLPRAWRRRRRALFVLCAAFGAATLLLLPHIAVLSPTLNPAMPGLATPGLPSLLLAQIFLGAAVLYGGDYARRSFAGLMGAFGLLAWGAFYLVPVCLPHAAGSMRVFYEFWDLPKYLVGFAMIVQVFEGSQADLAHLAKGYQALYEDFRLMYENHPHPMWIYDAATKRLLSANTAAAASYGFSQQELLEMRMTDLELPEENDSETASFLLLHAADGRRTRHRRRDGSVVWVNVSDRDIVFQGKDARLVIARDVTRQLNLTRELAHRAHHDALTGLPNRVLLEERILQCIDRSTAAERKAVLLTIDIDHFKRVNDSFGHQVGDECLKAVAGRLKSKIRQVDTIARAGGEEFVAIVGGLATAADARKVTASLLALFEAPLHLSCGNIPVTVSIGGAIFPDDAVEVAELQVKSDQALYSAKRAGRNRAVFASSDTAPGSGSAFASSSPTEPPAIPWLTVAAEALPAKAGR